MSSFLIIAPQKSGSPKVQSPKDWITKSLDHQKSGTVKVAHQMSSHQKSGHQTSSHQKSDNPQPVRTAPYARWALLLGTSLKISGKYRLIRLHWGPLLWKLRAFVGTLIQNWTWCYFLLTFCIVNTSNLTNCANSQGRQDQDCLDWSLIFKISKYWIVKERTISKVDN